jgi:hypothetical protein
MSAALLSFRYSLESAHRNVIHSRDRVFSAEFYKQWGAFFSAYGPGHGCTELSSAAFLATKVSSSAGDKADGKIETQVRSDFTVDNEHALSSSNSSPCFNFSTNSSLRNAADPSKAWGKIDLTAPTEYVCVYSLWLANPELKYGEVVAIAINWFEEGIYTLVRYIYSMLYISYCMCTGTSKVNTRHLTPQHNHTHPST